MSDVLSTLGQVGSNPRGKMKYLHMFLLLLVLGHDCFAQQSSQASQPQPLNASVSNFGTTFVFSPQPICAGCLESELGYISILDGGRYAPVTMTVAPFSTPTDFNVLANVLANEEANGKRTTHFGNRFDFVVRQQLLRRGGFVLTLAPRGVVFTRDLEGGRAGATVAAQYGNGNNLGVINLTYTAAAGCSSTNPKNEYQGSYDFYRILSERGYAFFLGFQHTGTTGNPHALGTELGIVVPFRNGQVELASQQLSLSTNPVWQFQARVTVNWGNLLRK